MGYSSDDLGKMLVQIVEISRKISEPEVLKGLNGDVLSYTGTRLASLKASILDLKVESHRDMLEKEVQKDQAKAEAYYKFKKEHGTTAAGDMKYMDENLQEKMRAFNESKVQYDKLRTLLGDTHDLIESLRSRVIELQGQRKNEK